MAGMKLTCSALSGFTIVIYITHVRHDKCLYLRPTQSQCPLFAFGYFLDLRDLNSD
jgi:hypothetical protein